MKKMVLSLLVDNTSGVLSRVSGMFSRRGYNIDSLSVGVTENPRYSRMTVAVSGDDRILSQIKKQLLKLEDVCEITELKDGESVCRELLLVKIKASLEARSPTKPDSALQSWSTQPPTSKNRCIRGCGACSRSLPTPSWSAP